MKGEFFNPCSNCGKLCSTENSLCPECAKGVLNGEIKEQPRTNSKAINAKLKTVKDSLSTGIQKQKVTQLERKSARIKLQEEKLKNKEAKLKEQEKKLRDSENLTVIDIEEPEILDVIEENVETVEIEEPVEELIVFEEAEEIEPVEEVAEEPVEEVAEEPVEEAEETNFDEELENDAEEYEDHLVENNGKYYETIDFEEFEDDIYYENYRLKKRIRIVASCLVTLILVVAVAFFAINQKYKLSNSETETTETTTEKGAVHVNNFGSADHAQLSVYNPLIEYPKDKITVKLAEPYSVEIEITDCHIRRNETDVAYNNSLIFKYVVRDIKKAVYNKDTKETTYESMTNLFEYDTKEYLQGPAFKMDFYKMDETLYGSETLVTNSNFKYADVGDEYELSLSLGWVCVDETYLLEDEKESNNKNEKFYKDVVKFSIAIAETIEE